VTGFAAQLGERLLAERHEILEILFVGVAPGNRWQLQLPEIGRLVPGVADREWPLLHDDERGATPVFAAPDRTGAGAFDDDTSTKVGAVAHVEDEGILEFVVTLVDTRGAEPHVEGLPFAVAGELEGIAALNEQFRAGAFGRAEFERGDAVGQRGSRGQPPLGGRCLAGQRAVNHGPGRVVAECTFRRCSVLPPGDMETCERGNGQNRHRVAAQKTRHETPFVCGYTNAIPTIEKRPCFGCFSPPMPAP
jgi:hypothetical protein